jgi:phosphohistidine phosphatase
MKKLTIIRHAKSSWEHDFKDINRPLKKSGIADAQRVSSSLERTTLTGCKWFSSPANRAFSTAKIFAEKLNFPIESIQIISELYDFGGHNLREFVKNLSDSDDHVLIFGHNHAITDFANVYGSVFIENVPTCGVVQLELPINSWQELEKGLTYNFIRPKDLRP